MEGVVDAIMRDLLTSIGGYERCVTEFIRVSQTILPKRVFLRYAPELTRGGTTVSGVPVYLQLLGSNPELMAANAARATEMGARGIDLNFGCPAKTVNRSEGGAALLRNPSRINSICDAVRDKVPQEVPVTAKIRLGYETDEYFGDILSALAKSDLTEITIHARTRKQGYRSPVHWHRLQEARAILPFPVIANGDLWSPSDVKRCARVSGCDAFMLARGALCRPNLAQAVHSGFTGKCFRPFDWTIVKDMLLKFLRDNQKRYNPRYAVNPIKQWLVYLKVYYPQAAALFSQVKRITDPGEMLLALVAQTPTDSSWPTDA